MREKRDLGMATAALIVLLTIVILIVGIRIAQMPPQPSKTENVAPEQNPNNNTETAEARIVQVIPAGPAQAVQRLELEVISGQFLGEHAQVELGATDSTGHGLVYHAGDQVLVDFATREDGGHTVMITDYVRTGALALLGLLFISFTVLVSGWKGIRSLVGLAASFVVLMGFVVPHILAGQDAVLVSMTGSFALLTVTLYLTLGWSLKTHTSLLGVLFTLILIGLLSAFAVDLTHLNGAASDDALTIQATGASVDLRGLLLAGFIIGTLGVLADVVVTQASAVMELAEANPALGWRELYRRAMNIGHDHIAATINTLVMAYVGAALPLLLLFQLYPEPWTITINRGFVAEEIVRTLVGSLGLVAAVPITTITASLLREWQSSRASPSPITAPDSMH